MPKLVYRARIVPASDRTQWRADVVEKGRTTAFQVRCSGTLSFGQQSPVCSNRVLRCMRCEAELGSSL